MKSSYDYNDLRILRAKAAVLDFLLNKDKFRSIRFCVEGGSECDGVRLFDWSGPVTESKCFGGEMYTCSFCSSVMCEKHARDIKCRCKMCGHYTSVCSKCGVQHISDLKRCESCNTPF